MKLFDKNDPRHREILREEVAKVLKEQINNDKSGTDEQLAKNTNDGRTNLRLIKNKLDMDTANPFPDNPYNKLVIKYLDIVNVETLNDITTEQSYDLLTKINNLQTKISDTPMWGNVVKTDVNPYDMPGGSSTGYMGSTYRGD